MTVVVERAKGKMELGTNSEDMVNRRAPLVFFSL